MSEIRTMTDRIIRQLYGDGGSTIRKEVLAGLRAGTSLTSPRARAFWPVLMEISIWHLLNRLLRKKPNTVQCDFMQYISKEMMYVYIATKKVNLILSLLH